MVLPTGSLLFQFANAACYLVFSPSGWCVCDKEMALFLIQSYFLSLITSVFCVLIKKLSFQGAKTALFFVTVLRLFPLPV